ncbi:MAG: hypothetical protein PHV82_02800, partial [Victivallaceae bacterium]|nr:hypothetical protein [Victivallaceae bacterium]
MPSNKKNKKSKAHKRLERERNVARFLKENPDIEDGFEEFAAKFLKSSGIDINKLDKSNPEAKGKLDKYLEVAVLAWELSRKVGTYEQAILGLTLKPLNEFGLANRTALKVMLVMAFRIIFSLPVDAQNVIRSGMAILTPEEQMCLDNNVNLEFLE